jgi:membrane protein
MIKNIARFVKEEIWLLSEQNLSLRQAWAVKCLKILLLSAQGFKKNSCELQASALTLYTLLSIVPVIAMLFGIAKGFGLEKTLQQQLLLQVPKHDSLLIRLIEFAENMLANTQGGVVAGMGVVLLFWTVIKVISTVEEAFNQIWQIKQGRTLARKLSDYLSLMLLAPILLVIASSMTVFVHTQINWLVKTLSIPDSGSSVLLTLLNYLPILIMAGLFSFVFAFIPNQKIQLKAAIIAGTITGIIYQVVQAAYLGLQVGVSGYNAIYGSFAALPLFLIWLQLGWLIVLFGCEIAFFIQNYETYRHNEQFSELSFSLKKVLALKITHLLVQQFAKAETALSLTEIAEQLNLPIAVVHSILVSLINSRLIAEIKSSADEEARFQPAQDIELITVYAVIAGLENQGVQSMPDMQAFEIFVQINECLNLKIQTAAENYLLKQLTGAKSGL